MKTMTVKVINMTDPYDNGILFTGIYDELVDWLMEKAENDDSLNDQALNFNVALTSNVDIVRYIEHLGYKTYETLITFTPDQEYKPLPNQYSMFTE